MQPLTCTSLCQYVDLRTVNFPSMQSMQQAMIERAWARARASIQPFKCILLCSTELIISRSRQVLSRVEAFFEPPRRCAGHYCALFKQLPSKHVCCSLLTLGPGCLHVQRYRAAQVSECSMCTFCARLQRGRVNFFYQVVHDLHRLAIKGLQGT